MDTRRKHFGVRTKLCIAIAFCVLAPSVMANHTHHIKRHHFARHHGIGHLLYPAVVVPVIAPRVAPAATVTTNPTTKLFAYPARGQTQEQQSRDNYDCHTWAAGQSGFDPSAPSATHTGAPANHALHTAAGGAALGAIGGAVAGDPGIGAAVGATLGGVIGLTQQAEQSAIALRNAQNREMLREEYNRAAAACYVARGYSVN